MDAPGEQQGIVVWDFVSRLPYKIWISGWQRDSEFPAGFQYKVIATRCVDEGLIEWVVLVQNRADGSKQVLQCKAGRPEGFDRYMSDFLEALGKEHRITFEEQDLSAVQTEEDFDRAKVKMGWVTL